MEETSSAARETVNYSLLGRFDEFDSLVPLFVATNEAAVPTGFFASPLGYDIEGFCQVIEGNEAADLDPCLQPVKMILSLEHRVGRITRYVQRGVLVFQFAGGGDYQLAAGSDADGSCAALVKDCLVGHFVAAFGGTCSESAFSGWCSIKDCLPRTPRRG